MLLLLTLTDALACINSEEAARTDYVALAVVGASVVATFGLVTTSALDFGGFLPTFRGRTALRIGTLGALLLSGVLIGLYGFRMLFVY